MSEAGSSRLDNIQNKSDEFFQAYRDYLLLAKDRAKKNNAWAQSHRLVSPETGEFVTDKEGNALTLADMSRSWYSEKGGRNNAFQIVKRLQKAHSFECDLKTFRPKFITLTFAGIVESWEAERAIQKFLDALRHWAKRQGVKGLAYFWTSEVQERGALHYHILILGTPYLSKKLLASWWSYGFIDVRAVDDIGRAFKYLAKYLWKWGHLAGDPDALPAWWFLFSVFSKRRYGFSKWFQLPLEQRLPRWLKESLQGFCKIEDVEKARRAVGGGWEVVACSSVLGGVLVQFHFPSPFKVVECSP
jgi:hypothetical protein